MQSVVFSTASDVIPELEYLSNSVPLIPGLPDDVALHCLLRLPISCTAVCKRWNDVLGNKGVFLGLSKRLGFKDPWLFVIDSARYAFEIQCHVLDLTNMSWHSMPPIPLQHKVFSYRLQCDSIRGEDEDVVYVCGKGSVYKFKIQNNRWIEMKRMNSTRSYYACGMMNGMIYVAGGLGESGGSMDSAEVLDPAKGSWHPIATMGRSTISFRSAVLDGKLHSWPWSFQQVQVYDPTNDKWEISTSVGLTQQRWEGRSAVVYGHLMLFEYERGDRNRKLKVYKSENDSWEEVEGPPLPKLISRSFVVNGCDNKAGGILCVVGDNLHVAMGYISILNKNQTGSSKFSVRWQEIPAPKGLSKFIPQTCQLLYA